MDEDALQSQSPPQTRNSTPGYNPSMSEDSILGGISLGLRTFDTEPSTYGTPQEHGSPGGTPDRTPTQTSRVVSPDQASLGGDGTPHYTPTQTHGPGVVNFAAMQNQMPGGFDPMSLYAQPSLEQNDDQMVWRGDDRMRATPTQHQQMSGGDQTHTRTTISRRLPSISRRSGGVSANERGGQNAYVYQNQPPPTQYQQMSGGGQNAYSISISNERGGQNAYSYDKQAWPPAEEYRRKVPSHQQPTPGPSSARPLPLTNAYRTTIRHRRLRKSIDTKYLRASSPLRDLRRPNHFLGLTSRSNSCLKVVQNKVRIVDKTVDPIETEERRGRRQAEAAAQNARQELAQQQAKLKTKANEITQHAELGAKKQRDEFQASLTVAKAAAENAELGARKQREEYETSLTAAKEAAENAELKAKKLRENIKRLSQRPKGQRRTQDWKRGNNGSASICLGRKEDSRAFRRNIKRLSQPLVNEQPGFPNAAPAFQPRYIPETTRQKRQMEAGTTATAPGPGEEHSSEDEQEGEVTSRKGKGKGKAKKGSRLQEILGSDKRTLKGLLKELLTEMDVGKVKKSRSRRKVCRATRIDQEKKYQQSKMTVQDDLNCKARPFPLFDMLQALAREIFRISTGLNRAADFIHYEPATDEQVAQCGEANGERPVPGVSPFYFRKGFQTCMWNDMLLRGLVGDLRKQRAEDPNRLGIPDVSTDYLIALFLNHLREGRLVWARLKPRLGESVEMAEVRQTVEAEQKPQGAEGDEMEQEDGDGEKNDASLRSNVIGGCQTQQVCAWRPEKVTAALELVDRAAEQISLKSSTTARPRIRGGEISSTLPPQGLPKALYDEQWMEDGLDMDSDFMDDLDVSEEAFELMELVAADLGLNEDEDMG
ncbi:hypothetical protein K438DRAFT_1779972 [Mycena galopus ATCC 62051]|nr:hypothetical protein K438DRAFT_1779972 [Mycena galopus ATCC 62051]